MTESKTMKDQHLPVDLLDDNLFKLQCLIRTTGLLCNATCEFDTSRILALVTENSEIIIYLEKKTSLPIVKRMLWFQGSHKQVSALCFDITGAYLLSVSVDGSLYVIPALAFVDECHTDDSRWNKTDITFYPYVVSQSTYSRPTAIVWWQVGSQMDIAIVGTECGEIIFINLETRQRIFMTCVNEKISMLKVCEDKNSNNKYLLITSQLKQQWRLNLEEQENSCSHSLDESRSSNIEDSNNSTYNDNKPFAFTRSKFQELKQLSVEKFAMLKQKLTETKPVNSRQSLDSPNSANRSISTVDSELSSDSDLRIVTAELLPTHIFFEHQSISASQQLYTSYDRGNNSVTFHGLNFSPLPLVEYKVPILIGNIIFTQKFLFVTNVNKQSIYIISSQLSEISSNKQSDISAECIIGKFSLSESKEVIQSIYKSTDFETEKHKLSDNVNDMYNLPENVKNIALDVPRVDTVIVVTNRSVYKIVLRMPLLYVLMDTILMRNDIERAKTLGIVFGINLPQLLDIAGDIVFANKEDKRAVDFYKASKCRIVKSVLKFAAFGHTDELRRSLAHCLTSPGIMELSVTTRIHYSNLSILLLTQIMLRTNTSALSKIHKDFIHFLSNNHFYDELLAVRIVGQVHLWEVLHFLATKRGLHEQMLNILLKNGSYFGIPLDNFHFLPYGFLMCISEPTSIQAMVLNYELGQIHMNFIIQHLPEFPVFLLERLVSLYDPTNPIIRSRLMRCREHHGAALYESQSSQNECTSPAGDTVKVDTLIVGFIETFLLILLTLIHNKSYGRHQYLWPTDGVQLFDPKEGLKLKVDFRKRLISAGFSHATLIRNGYLFTWGCANRGSLGNGPSVFKYDVARPLTFFNKMKLEVLSVSCGHHHTLAVTNNGVYAWGSSQYGQLGIDGVFRCSSPELIISLAQEVIVDAVAGQYHSVALTADGRVFTWGWGVHGQLGHGNTDERHTPTLVSRLLGVLVYCISAGHAHTLVLSTEGIVYVFGCNVFGQLGTGNTQKYSIPIQVFIPEKVSLIASGYFHNLAVTCTNKLYTWGASPQNLRVQAQALKKTQALDKKVDGNVDDREDVGSPEKHTSDSKQEENVPMNLCKRNIESKDEVEQARNVIEINGNRSNANSPPVKMSLEEPQMHLTPSLVDTKLLNGQIVQISAGSHHNALITRDGSLYTWGRNADGQLGNCCRQDVNMPTPLTYNPSFIFAQVPPRHNNRTNIEKSVSSTENKENCPIVEKNNTGETQPVLREATNANQHVNPTIKVISISCGYDYTLAIQAGGAVLAWGNNNRCQLGRIPTADVKDEAMTKPFKRHMRAPQSTQMSVDTPCHVPNIPAPIISYQNYEFASFAECIRPLSLIEKSPGDLTLHYVLDRFFGLYDDAKILEKCIQFENYPACAKIAALQQNIPDAFSFQLKTLYAFNMNSLNELQTSVGLNESRESIDSVEESSPDQQRKSNTKLFNEQVEENLIETMQDSAMKNQMKISSSKSLNNLETLEHGLHNFDCQGAPEQLSTDSKCGNSMLEMMADTNRGSTMQRENSEEWIENILSDDAMLDKNNDQSVTNNVDVTNSNKTVSSPHTSTSRTHAEGSVNSEVAFALRSQKNNVINEAIKLIKCYIQDIENGTIEIKCKILKRAIDFWISHDLPIQSLENAFVEHVNLIFYPLGLLIFCQDAVQKYLYNHESEVTHDVNRVNIFSLDFCLRICSMLLYCAEQGHLLPEYVTLLSSITASHYGPPLIGFPGSNENATFDQMMQGVISTISSANYEPKPFIHIKEPDSIYRFLLSENDAMVFTCGHNFPFSSFMLETIPGLETELLTSTLPCTAQFLEKLFGKAYGPQILCPVCVPHALKMLIKNDVN